MPPRFWGRSNATQRISAGNGACSRGVSSCVGGAVAVWVTEDPRGWRADVSAPAATGGERLRLRSSSPNQTSLVFSLRRPRLTPRLNVPDACRQPISVGESFTAETRDGDVQVRFADAPAQIKATTRDGDVDISLPTPGPYLVRAQSGDGSATVRVPQTPDPARAAATVTASTRDGEISVETLRSIGR